MRLLWQLQGNNNCRTFAQEFCWPKTTLGPTTVMLSIFGAAFSSKLLLLLQLEKRRGGGRTRWARVMLLRLRLRLRLWSHQKLPRRAGRSIKWNFITHHTQAPHTHTDVDWEQPFCNVIELFQASFRPHTLTRQGQRWARAKGRISHMPRPHIEITHFL